MNPLIDDFLTALNTLGRGFCDYAGSMFVQSGVLIILLLIVDLLIRKRVRATLRYWIWMLIFIKLILPPSLSLPTGIGYWRSEISLAGPPILKQETTTVQYEPPEWLVLEDLQAPVEAWQVPQAQPLQAIPEQARLVPTVVSRTNPLKWQAIVLVLWFVGVMIFSVLLIQRIVYVRRLIAQSKPAEKRFIEILNPCREGVGIRLPVSIRLSNEVSSPAVCGFFKPVILMPASLIRKLSPDKLRAVLIHELCHIKRGDLWINSAQTLLQIVYFYNPLIWLVNVVVRRIREQAVDEMVLVALGTGARDYSNILIGIAEKVFLKSNLSLRLIGVVESKKALEGRIRHMANRPIPKNVKLGILGLMTVLFFGAILLPMARAQKQSTDDASAILDSDKDGLENTFEAELGTNPNSSDTDGDGLSDYDEHCKYRTDPTKKDSDGDGKPDGDWQERREYVYSIRAICEIRSPSNLEMVNDLYQDALPTEKKATLDDARVVGVLIFPFSKAHVYAQPYPRENLGKEFEEYIRPTASMNYSPEMKEQIDRMVEGASTDVEAIEKMLLWMNNETSLAREMPHWEYLYVIDGDIVWHQSLGDPARDKQFLETNFLGDSMFKNKVHGTCSSTAILRGTMFRAAGLPTRLIQTLPLMTRYSKDPEPLADRLRMREISKGYDWGPGSGGANHTYNEVFLNNRWVRVDNSIGTDPFVGDKLFVKAWSSPDWNNLKEEWNDKRCFRALDVSDAYPKYESAAFAKADIVIEDKDLSVTELSDGQFRARVGIHNNGHMLTPRFKVIFYAGDPDKKGRKVYPGHHNAGPIMPNGTWNEGTLPFTLNEGETEIFVIVDPDNMVDELDETNNKASRTISTTVKVRSAESTESAKVDIAIEDKDLEVIKLSDQLFEATIPLRNRGSVPIPRFRVNFCAGDPDKGVRLLSAQAAGPIMPGDTWREYNPGLKLEPDETVISVVVDPDNKVEESDETNNKASQAISEIVSESEKVDKVGTIQKVNLAGDDILQIEPQEVKGFNFPFYLFIPSGIDKDKPIFIFVETNNSGTVSDDLEFHRAKALKLAERSYANEMARRLSTPLLVPTFPRPKTNWWVYTHALDIDTLETEEGKLKRIDLQLTAMIKYAQELLRINGFKINEKVFMHGFSASAKFCNRYSFLHPEMVKAVAAGGVNGLPTLPIREWNGCELPFPIGIAGIERFINGSFNEEAFRNVAHYIYMGSVDKNDTLPSRDAWREEEADIIKKALAEKMMPDRWELSRKIYSRQKLPAQLVTYNGVGHAIRSQMQDDVINFFKANSGENYVQVKPYEYPPVEFEESRPRDTTKSAKIDIAIDDKDLIVRKQPDGSIYAMIRIHNKGSYPFPQFGVYFYAGDPEEGGRLLATHGAGPIMPGNGWGEYNPGLKLKSGENTISVVVDPDNKVDETNETNNKASALIPGRQPKEPVEADILTKQTTQEERKTAARKVSGIDIKPASFNIFYDKDRGSYIFVVSIQNESSLIIPKFKLKFYRGDPGDNLDEAGKVHSGWHGAGPIEPGNKWNEGTTTSYLPDGQYEFNVVLDYDNSISEINENNNQATLKVKIENGQIADQSVTCPSSLKELKTDARIETKEMPTPSIAKTSSSSSKPNIFIMSLSNFGNFREIFSMVEDKVWNKTGRYHNKKSYDEIFVDEIHNKKPGDILVLLFSLDSPDRIPTEYEDILPKPWSDVEAALKQGQTVELKGKARELNVILLAAPTGAQLRSLVHESPLLNPSAKSTPSMVKTSGFSVSLSDGTKVELVGVCEHPNKGKQWWRPDGSLMEKTPYQSMGSRLKHHEGYNDYEFVMRLTGPADTSYRWSVPGGRQGTSTGAPVDKDGNRISDLRVYTVNQRQDKMTASVRIGVTAGKWNTLATHVPQDEEETYSLKDGAIAFGVPYEKDGETFLPVVHNFNRGRDTVAIRVMAITHSGQQLGSSCSGSGGNVLSSLTYGFDTPLDNIREFQFLTRPYTWIDFQNVSLRPGIKTNVKSSILQSN